MVKLVALYRKPADPAVFDKAYFETHVPLVKKIPNLRRVDVARATGAPRGESEYYLTADTLLHKQTNFWKEFARSMTIGYTRDWLSVHCGKKL